jgi:adenine-specific DNA methylase
MQKAFIETQFPIARLSAEAYKERKANNGQTLTRLGKWWGRKPLILVRACILGMLMPASDDPKKDREIFLKILTMDDEATWDRCKVSVRRKTSRQQFDHLPYAERIANCDRPENIAGPSAAAWAEINAHLNTQAQSLPELIIELGKNQFGHPPRVGDCFCGGGSIPFEAARIGCEAFGSDLNPVAGLLTWASLNLLGGGKAVQEEVRRVQEAAFVAADKQITGWGIEHNERGERAEAFLYCVEVKPEGCDYYIPLAPSWVISEKYRIVAKWSRVPDSDRLQPTVEAVSESELKLYKAKKGVTVVDSRVIDPFEPNRTWSVEALRGPEGLRRWSNEDVVPRPSDVFQERLYCIRWINAEGERRYAAPDAADLAREAKVLELLRERFAAWQDNGFIPSKQIVSGYNTDQPIRERGWTHWHHLFTPRQLLINGFLSSLCGEIGPYALSRISNLADFNSRLTRYPSTRETINNTFSNQALNTVYNYPCRALSLCKNVFVFQSSHEKIMMYPGNCTVRQVDARDIDVTCDTWITDPPYADAINYHELSDFFLAWYQERLRSLFPGWTPDARAELAVRGDGEDFKKAMVEIYQNLARHMPEDGMQLVMFTHQNPGVWADLGMILWAAGLKATAAWTISTETEAAGIKKGNYVQGTVCLVLRKRSGSEPGFLFDIYPMVEDEVRAQIVSMQALDEAREPNFNDSDYQLAAYAAALKVLTQYSTLDGKNVTDEVFAVRSKNEKSDFEQVIERAITIACDALIPKGLNESWRDLNLIERYYLRAVDIESRGERRKGMYEELARGFGVTDIKPLLKSDKANGTRVHTPSGFGTSLLAPIEGAVASTDALPRRGRATSSGPHPFAATPLRHLLFAVCETAAADNDPNQGRQYLRDTFGQTYWGRREGMVRLLDWLAALGNSEDTADWAKDSEAARILAGRLRNDDA